MNAIALQPLQATILKANRSPTSSKMRRRVGAAINTPAIRIRNHCGNQRLETASVGLSETGFESGSSMADSLSLISDTPR
jgi:hypothetical protein